MKCDAEVSADGRYRYRLSRTWGVAPPVTFVMLNPSTATANVDDPTIRRCVGFARGWGFGGLTVVNLYAYRTTRPGALWQVKDPVGPENDDRLKAVFADGGLIVAAWGMHARPNRIAQVLAFAPPLVVLALTKSGEPRHPLYLPGTLRPVPWPQGRPRGDRPGATVNRAGSDRTIGELVRSRTLSPHQRAARLLHLGASAPDR